MSASTTEAAPARRSRVNTRARLVEAAADVFADKPFGAVTVDDLVGAAGFTRGAFYSNFSSVREVFVLAYAQQSVLMLDEVNRVVDDTPEGEFHLSSIDQLFAALEPLGPRWFRLHQEFTLLAVRDEEARSLFLAHVEEFEGRMQRLFERILGLLGREPISDIASLSEALMALYQHSLGTQQLGAGHLTPEVLVGDLLPQLLIALSRPRSA
ncbi:TetR/AcrR family transcriptional regulator [Nocardioides marmoribigeumensis]|uniref:AcrR family transcriptional regulator n=1 Tax=Nocardioides marmoribigeumensis TaxID=433649 RepID=A0ABU2C1P3_9ACTN|nr:TetR/AcrR family transcriptional regulator [Nocardioides marmoribigeumensis]MDR7364597.1 AcrR family transcriptional regulator [Nocardioides marmoribigeumensis]